MTLQPGGRVDREQTSQRNPSVSVHITFPRLLNFIGNKNDSCRLSTQNATNHGGQMPNKKQDLIDQRLQDLNDDRRGFLKCMAWAGTGLVWTMSGGIPVSRAFAKT